jgi:uncharacterized integral membrane protein
VSDRETDGGHTEEPPFDQDYGSFVPEPPEQTAQTPIAEPETVPDLPESAAVPPQDRVFAGTGISWAFVFGAILTAAIIILAVQNTDSVPVKLFFWETEAPLIIVMLVTALVVILIDEIIGLIIRRRKRKMLAEREELKRLRAQADTKGLGIE